MWCNFLEINGYCVSVVFGNDILIFFFRSCEEYVLKKEKKNSFIFFIKVE